MICQVAQIICYGNTTKSIKVVAVLAGVRNLVKCCGPGLSSSTFFYSHNFEQLNIFIIPGRIKQLSIFQMSERIEWLNISPIPCRIEQFCVLDPWIHKSKAFVHLGWSTDQESW